MPNVFASLVLYSYPLVVLVLFQKLDRPQALIWSIMAGYLFLPEQVGIDLPLLPKLDKYLIPSLSAAVMCLIMPERRDRSHRSVWSVQDQSHTARETLVDRLANLCLLVLFVAPIAIYITNTDPVIAGPRYIAGLRIYDIFSMMLSAGVTVLPLLLSRRYLNTPAAQLSLLRAFVAAGLVYAVLIVIEVRLSPQLNKWIYGFYSHSFAQHIRADGFRPMIFIQHGLRVGIFMVMATLAALTLYRLTRTTLTTSQDRKIASRSVLWTPRTYFAIFLCLLVILIMCKTIGSLFIALVMIPILGFMGSRLQTVIALGLTMLILLYPMLRAAEIVPVESIVATAEKFSSERAGSLQFRLDNEDILLRRAAEKPSFGWGDWGRGRVYDPQSGVDISITDGSWIIAFGSSGWVGYIARFGLLAVPVLTLAWRRQATPVITIGLSIMLLANLIDLIPNSGLTPLTWMLAGTLLARPVTVPVAVKTINFKDKPHHAGPRYTRFASARHGNSATRAI